MRILVLVFAAMSTASAANWEESPSKLAFVDLRVSGGATANSDPVVAVSLMCGDLGLKDQHVITIDQDAGIVIGVRGIGARVDAKLSGNQSQAVRLAGGEFLGGFGYIAGPKDHLELLGGYHMGVTTLAGDGSNFSRNGTYRGFGGELGWYHTWDSHVQIGILAGYSVRKLKLDSPGGRVSARVGGVDAMASLGYRF
ncbi:MAG: hypothetical protein H0V44_11735 [Planctomycetes bacterium]|nr:hypothetical protein [Planctomycetota bacterium]